MKPRSFLIRSILLALLIAGTVLGLRPLFLQIRQEHRVKAALLEIQRALQDYHVAQEHYPREYPLSGAELVRLLIDTGHLREPLRNPWTGLSYRFDGIEKDRLVYRSDSMAETYELQVIDPATGTPRLTLDSTEHPSLE